MTKNLEQQIIEFYLEWRNDYLTVEKMAEHKGMKDSAVNKLICLGRELHEDFVIEEKRRGKIPTDKRG